MRCCNVRRRHVPSFIFDSFASCLSTNYGYVQAAGYVRFFDYLCCATSTQRLADVMLRSAPVYTGRCVSLARSIDVVSCSSVRGNRINATR